MSPTTFLVLHAQSLETAVAELSTRSAANAAVISQLNTDIISLSALTGCEHSAQAMSYNQTLLPSVRANDDDAPDSEWRACLQAQPMRRCGSGCCC